MRATKMSLSLYRSLYWANQGLLHAVRALQEAETPSADGFNAKLRGAQAMIEETRILINRHLGEWIEPPE